MRGNTHIAIGLLFAVGAKELLKIPVTPLEVVVCVIGALLPDIDEPSSTISKPGYLLYPYIPKVLVKVINFVTHLVARIINWVFGHRSITHWPIFPVSFVIVAEKIKSPMLLMFGLGFLSHLLGDLCTAHGIPLFAPLRFKNISAFRLKVGGNTEALLATCLWLTLLYYFFVRTYLSGS